MLDVDADHADVLAVVTLVEQVPDLVRERALVANLLRVAERDVLSAGL